MILAPRCRGRRWRGKGRWGSAGGALAVWLILASVLSAAESPRLELDAEGQLVLADLPLILGAEEVKQHLTTGLTTSIVFRLDSKLVGGARVDIRYDLWDEVYYLAAWGHGERLQRAEVASFAELVEWWQGLELVLLESGRLPKPWPKRLKVAADVIPFSAAEQDDARRWLSESIEEGRRSATGEVGRADEPSAEPLSRTFNLLLATSIRRRALTSFRWSLSLPSTSSGEAP